MKIRPLNAADEEEWAQWVHRYLQTQLENVPKWGNDPQRARTAVPGLSFEPLSEQLKAHTSPPFIQLVVEEDWELLGQVLAEKRVEQERAYIWIHQLYVLANYRRTGKGMALLKEVIARARKAEVREIYTAFHVENSAMQSLLKRMGFEPFGRVHNGVYENWIWRKAL